MTVDLLALSKAVKAKRAASGRTLAAVAPEVGLSFATLARIERKEKMPELLSYIKLCRWLDVPLEHFVTSDTATKIE
jgi:transcriptional regulator with XRE-family HTH domain